MAETHEIIELEKKPSDHAIKLMISKYFDEQASSYDELSEKAEKRRLYLHAIDLAIADKLKRQKKLETVLSIGCGTGAREIRIRDLVGRNFQIVGVDPSTEMCKLTEDRGIKTINAFWSDAAIDNKMFDAIFYLHSFGSCPSKKGRQIEMQKVHAHLTKQGLFFVDVLNLHDKNEWGPEVLDRFIKYKLDQRGYEQGDLFYRRKGYQEVSFFHYFDSFEIRDLLERTGLTNINEQFVGYGARFGEVVGPTEGAILIDCQKP